MNFPSHDLNTAPEASRPLLEKSQKAFGRLPGLHKVLAESPQAYEAYQVRIADLGVHEREGTLCLPRAKE